MKGQIILSYIFESKNVTNPRAVSLQKFLNEELVLFFTRMCLYIL